MDLRKGVMSGIAISCHNLGSNRQPLFSIFHFHFHFPFCPMKPCRTCRNVPPHSAPHIPLSSRRRAASLHPCSTCSTSLHLLHLNSTFTPPCSARHHHDIICDIIATLALCPAPYISSPVRRESLHFDLLCSPDRLVVPVLTFTFY
jgi:hypothetical protein